MKKILLIEDSQKMIDLITTTLNQEYFIYSSQSVAGATMVLQNVLIDLIVLDLQLNQESGLAFFSRLSQNPDLNHIPVVFLTSNSEIENKVIAFNLGAADYITKPFDPQELIVRIRARINKSSDLNKNELRLGNIKINSLNHSVTVVENSKEILVVLSPIEFKLLSFFIKNPNQLFNRDQIFDAVWGDNTHYLERTIDRHISSLKKKLPLEGVLNSVYAEGYILKTG